MRGSFASLKMTTGSEQRQRWLRVGVGVSLGHDVTDAEGEGSADLGAVEDVGLEEEIKGEAVEGSGELGGALAFLGFGGVPELGQELVDFGHAAAEAHGGVEVGEALTFCGVADGVELELEREEGALAVVEEGYEVVDEGGGAVFGGGGFAEPGVDFLLGSGEVFLKDGKEDIFLVGEVAVEGSSGFAGAFGDVFEAGVFEAVLREDFAGGVDELPASEDGAFLFGSACSVDQITAWGRFL